MISAATPEPQIPSAEIVAALAQGLAESDRPMLARAFEFAAGAYAGKLLGTGEPAFDHASGLARLTADLHLDVDVRAAAVLFAVPAYLPDGVEQIARLFNPTVAALVQGITRLNQLRVVVRAASVRDSPQASQAEVLRKMLLAMVEDVRVVLLRLASRTQTLRYLAGAPDGSHAAVARETLDIYAPLANRLGIWQLKWELEDLSFRFLEPEIYKRIARMLDERRAQREAFIARAIGALQRALAAAGVDAEISGRPKHLYSIYSKMRAKSLDFSEVYDLRALRVLVDDVKDCYTALGIVHDLWQPIPEEFDDYISRPKANLYRSLHTAVIGPDGGALEVQIRTREMHRHAELGVAAHWRYKEGTGVPEAGGRRADRFDEKIAWLRQILAWRDDIVDSSDWVERSKRAALDDTVYVLTPLGRVIDLPQGATPVDFAYAVHTELGHRCRGAKVNGAMVPLDTGLKNGDRVEITAARSGGPSRDWLNAELGTIRSSRARNKVRQWFNSQELEQTIAAGRAMVEREMRREGVASANLEQLAHRFAFDRTEEFFAAVGREEIGQRELQGRLRGEQAGEAPAIVAPRERMRASRALPSSGGILVVGVDRLLTQLARCCKPAPPDPITGFVTRGRGVSIHRKGCADLARLLERFPERTLAAEWGGATGRVFAIDMVVQAADRQGLLRDIGDALAREHINVTAVNTQSRHGTATMFFTVEVEGLDRFQSALAAIREVRGVESASRR